MATIESFFLHVTFYETIWPRPETHQVPIFNPTKTVVWDWRPGKISFMSEPLFGRFADPGFWIGGVYRNFN